MQKEDQGMYQCFVSNEWEMAQATAELQLGGAGNILLTNAFCSINTNNN